MLKNEEKLHLDKKYEQLKRMILPVSKWFSERKRYQRRLIIVLAVWLVFLFLLIWSDVGEWWHWEEWVEHIRANHM